MPKVHVGLCGQSLSRSIFGTMEDGNDTVLRIRFTVRSSRIKQHSQMILLVPHHESVQSMEYKSFVPPTVTSRKVQLAQPLRSRRSALQSHRKCLTKSLNRCLFHVKRRSLDLPFNAPHPIAVCMGLTKLNVSTFERHLKRSDTSLVRYIRTAPTTRFVNPSVIVNQMAYNTFNQTNGRLIRIVDS